jgi:hypothetical protein
MSDEKPLDEIAAAKNWVDRKNNPPLQHLIANLPQEGKTELAMALVNQYNMDNPEWAAQNAYVQGAAAAQAYVQSGSYPPPHPGYYQDPSAGYYEQDPSPGYYEQDPGYQAHAGIEGYVYEDDENL